MSETTPTFHYEPDSSAGSFVALLAQELTPTVDGRMFTEGAISWRELPIPLTLQRLNKAEGQHKEAAGVGAITEIWREGSAIYGRGFFSSDEVGQEARRLIGEGMISTVSADVGGVRHAELSAEETYPEGVTRVLTKGTILGVTALLHASFNETRIAVESVAASVDAAIDENDSLSAAADEVLFDPSLFENPNLTAPTPLTVTADGHVYGHAAIFGTCHVGYRDRCVTPPRSASNYAYFATGNVLTAAAGTRNVGTITAATGHASLELAAQPAREHYDHTGFAAAYVSVGEDSHGIWFSGTVAPQATPAQIANLRASGVSGDWRKIGGNLEMVGLLAVNTPGFPVPRPQAGLVAGAEFSLIAAGMVDPEEVTEIDEESFAADHEEEFTVEELAKKGGACCSACAGKDDEDEEMTIDGTIEPGNAPDVELSNVVALLDLDVSFAPSKQF